MTTTTHTPRALTVRQPWADAIAHHGKHVENRSWQLPTRHAGARILIHAGAADDRSVRDPQPGSLLDGTSTAVRSAIIATATLSGCHWAGCCCTPWGQPGVYHWQLADVQPLPVPVPCKGRLGLWVPDDELLAAVDAQLAPAVASSGSPVGARENGGAR